ncbi:MAG: serine phosphatase RsbU (regulator of sigma subunit) [Parvicellaceae bacterium]|jgi:serine phosphatase RsbU (regulator of sigma subunit)
MVYQHEQRVRKKLALHHLEYIEISVEEDLSKYAMQIPVEFEELLKLDPEGNDLFHAFTAGKQRTLIHFVAKFKSSDKRIEKALIIVNYIKYNFYWLEKNKGSILFAAADCTGHGVPGALVSIVFNNALNRSVREFKLRDPGEILDKTREAAIEEFLDQNSDKQVTNNGESIKDGMDIAICSVRVLKLTNAGAHNPLWIYRNLPPGQAVAELIEIKADKQPIGQFEHSSSFKTHELELLKGDTIYLFSDGYADQFNGEKERK